MLTSPYASESLMGLEVFSHYSKPGCFKRETDIATRSLNGLRCLAMAFISAFSLVEDFGRSKLVRLSRTDNYRVIVCVNPLLGLPSPSVQKCLQLLHLLVVAP